MHGRSYRNSGAVTEIPQEIAPTKASFPLSDFERPDFPDREYDIRDFGARGRAGEYNHFETGDDVVVLKSGFNEVVLEIGIPTENVVVRNFTAREVRTGSGAVVFGSETSGGIRNVYVHGRSF